jgi:hypothetical protein
MPTGSKTGGFLLGFFFPPNHAIISPIFFDYVEHLFKEAEKRRRALCSFV